MPATCPAPGQEPGRGLRPRRQATALGGRPGSGRDDGGCLDCAERENRPIAAIVVTAVYVAFAAILWSQAGNSETEAGRRLLLFSGIQAVAFSGVGWLFGKEVNKGIASAAADADGRATEAARGH